MIECKSCGIPTLPLILFWEGLFRAKCPCLCGSLERVGERSRVAAPGHIVDEDWYAEDRAANEGMFVRGAIIAVRSQQAAIPCDDEAWAETQAEMRAEIRAEIMAERLAESRASNEGMPEQTVARAVKARVIARSYREIVEEAGGAAEQSRKYKTVNEIMAAKRQQEADVKFKNWLETQEKKKRYEAPEILGNSIVLKYVFKGPSERSIGTGS